MDHTLKGSIQPTTAAKLNSAVEKWDSILAQRSHLLEAIPLFLRGLHFIPTLGSVILTSIIVLFLALPQMMVMLKWFYRLGHY
jgi:hypothetical protein